MIENEYYKGSLQVFEVGMLVSGEFIYRPIGLLERHSFSESTAFIGTTTRETDGWTTSEPLQQSFTATLNGVAYSSGYLGIEDVAVLDYNFIKRQKRDRVLLDFRIVSNNGTLTETFKGYFESVQDTSASGKFVRYTASIKGYGGIETDYNPVIETPFTNNFQYDNPVNF